VRGLADAVAGVARRDLAIFRTYPMRPLSLMFSQIVSLTLFFYISRLVHSADVGTPSTYYAYVVIGMITLAVLTSCLVTPIMTLRQEILTGTFERMVLSPFGPVRSVVSLMAFPLLLAYVTSLFTIAFAGVVFGLSLHWSTAALAIPIALLGAVAFAPFGLLMATGTILFKQTRGGTTFAITLVTVISGIYFPTVLLPHWLRWLSDVQPFTSAVSLLRHELVGAALAEPVSTSLLKMVLFPAVLFPLMAWLLNWAVEVARRQGTIIEY
jgi:ABC-type multidrug transport system permease subunit